MDFSQIEKLTTDRRFQELKHRQEKSNVFTVVGQTHTEHWHSSFMSWLFDANSSLGLGHFPLARLLGIYLRKAKQPVIGIEDIYSKELNNIIFRTEKDAGMNGKKRSIDVYGESDKYIIVIENKVTARENYNNSDIGQTQDYYDYVQAKMQAENVRKKALFFFISPSSGQQAFSEHYVKISYQEMYDCIISKCITHPNITESSKYLLEQYASNLREPVGNSPMALINMDMCRSLQEDFSEDLDIIFSAAENASEYSGENLPELFIYRHYQSIFDEIFLSVYDRTPKSRMQRRTVTFDDLCKAELISEGTRFTMNYDQVTYNARIAKGENDTCFLVLLDENGEYYRDTNGRISGVYTTPSRAAMDAVNHYRASHGMALVPSIRGTTYWIADNNKSFLQLVDEYENIK